MTPTFTMAYPQFLMLIFLIVLFVGTIYASILIYHWYAYGANPTTNRIATILFMVGSLLALGGMATAIGMSL